MFEFLFKYSSAVFNRGTFLFASGWPLWGLVVAIAAVGVGLAVWILRNSAGSPRVGGPRAVLLWMLQTAVAAVLLTMIWHPALSVSALRAQQNIVAVVLDGSLSMSMADEGGSARLKKALDVLNGGLMRGLQEKFQVRLYRMGDHLERIDNLTQVAPQASATHIGESLKQVAADAASLPIGGVVLMSDGADNSGGVDLETLAEIRRQRIP